MMLTEQKGHVSRMFCSFRGGQVEINAVSKGCVTMYV